MVITKRKEEQLKFIFNWVFKHLKAKLYRELGQYDCNASEETFYQHYFGQVSEEMRLELSFFYRPTVRKHHEKCQKSFNLKFIRHIKMSRLFMEDFYKAIDHDLKQLHSQNISVKLRNFFERWEMQAVIEGKTDKLLDSMIRTIRNCKKFKFAWSFREILCAVETVKSCLDDPRVSFGY